jgi:hypothetical protein
MADIVQIEALGRKHAVILPDYAAREEIIVAHNTAIRRGGVTRMRYYSAVLGLCTRLGKESGADYAACAFDVLAYGGVVYGHLRKNGMTPEHIVVAASAVIGKLFDETFPTDKEIEEATGKSTAAGES